MSNRLLLHFSHFNNLSSAPAVSPDPPLPPRSSLSNRKLYHPNSAQLGMAAMRAGVTHLHAGTVEMAHELICKAYRILLVTHGPNHSVTRDLEVGDGGWGRVCCRLLLGRSRVWNDASSQVMRRQTEAELKLLKQDGSARPV